MKRSLALAARIALSALAAWKAYTATLALFVAKMVPLPELPFAATAGAIAFCAVMALTAAFAHIFVWLTRRKLP